MNAAPVVQLPFRPDLDAVLNRLREIDSEAKYLRRLARLLDDAQQDDQRAQQTATPTSTTHAAR